MTYLVVGLDRATLARWCTQVMARNVSAAERVAHARAATHGIDLVVAAVIGAYSSVLATDEPR